LKQPLVFSGFVWKPKSTPPGYLKYALFWLGESQLKLGRLQEAKQYYKTVYEQFKNDPLAPEALWKMGFCDYQLGNTKDSIEMFQLFKTQFKDSPLLLSAHYVLSKIFPDEWRLSFLDQRIKFNSECVTRK